MTKLPLRSQPLVNAPARLPAGAGRPIALMKRAETPAGARRRPRIVGRAINRKGLAVFTRQLATLVKAGMPILRGLEVLARQEKRLAFRTVLERVAETIRGGGTFSDGLSAHGKVFDRLYVNMVKAGETGGVLDVVLERLAIFMEKAQKISAKVKSAMIYPVIIICVAIAIVAVLMVVVVPRFEEIFTGLLRGQPLPALTQVLLNASGFVQQHVLIVLGALLGGAAAVRFLAQTRPGRRFTDWLLIHLPVLGDLVLKVAIAQFTRTFGTLLASGVPILQALVITRNTSGNVYLAEALRVVHDRVREGDSVARPLQATHVFPGMVTSMIEVGEETGALPEMLMRIADSYEDEVDNAVAGLTSIVEPIMIVVMAVMVGGIVIALFLPLVSLIQHLS